MNHCPVKRKPCVISRKDQLGPAVAVARFMGLSYSYLSAVKKAAALRDNDENPTPFTGNKTSAARVHEWLERNRDFIPSRTVSPARPA